MLRGRIVKIRIASWNIHKCIGGVDRRYQPARVVEVLRHHEPDILLLQEVDEGAKRSRLHRQIDLIGDALGLRHRCYGVTHRLWHQGHYGNAILSRWPLVDTHKIDLTIGTRKRRGAIYAHARVRNRGGRTRTVVFYNLHLGLAGSERGTQLQRFLNSHPFAGLHSRTPVVVGGDFNDLWGTLGKKYLVPAGFRRVGRVVNTFPAVLPMRPLDGVYIRGDIPMAHCAVSRMRLARVASDHLPMIATLEGL